MLEEKPLRRRLKIFAGDPMIARLAGQRMTLEIENDVGDDGSLLGSRLHVIDFDGANRRYYQSVNLESREVLVNQGLEPSESDPRFHQQMVFAVASNTLENFDRALGRRIEFIFQQNSRRPLRLVPHAFHGQNAFYDPDLHAILFGYLRADSRDPGPNLPGQMVFTCLSHDIIAHEMTHAIVHRLRPHFLEPTNEDVLAFHEGFADTVALLQHFTMTDFLREEIQNTRTDLRKPTLLADLARQFGYATGTGKALRSALANGMPDPTRYLRVVEEHSKGAILVSAIFDAFFTTYLRRIRDLVRIATGGTGNLPDADLHPDLVTRIAAEASKTAQIILTMCIRAFDYLPPVDVTFGDYLRALVTADYELSPDDPFGQRLAVVEAFRKWGIYPSGARSLAEESLLWDSPNDLVIPEEFFAPDFAAAALTFNRDRKAVRSTKREVAQGIYEFASKHFQQLKLDPDRVIRVEGFHPVFRTSPGGQIVAELVCQLVQEDVAMAAELGGLPLRGGTTLIVGGDGRVRYAVAKPILPENSRAETAGYRAEGATRFERQKAFLKCCDGRDPRMAYADDAYEKNRMRRRMSFAALHGGLM